MTDDTIVEQLLDDDEFGCNIVCESLSRDIERTARGGAFVTLLKEITNHPVYSALKSDPNIYTTGGERGEDYNHLLNAARKAVEHGFVYLYFQTPKDLELLILSLSERVCIDYMI